ncbi:MAG: hypothetical protein ACK6AD_06095 [Cyanobacteriota bacterium]
MADLVIRCQERDLAAALKLPLDLAMQSPLVGLDRQEDVGPLLLALQLFEHSPLLVPPGSLPWPSRPD